MAPLLQITGLEVCHGDRPAVMDFSLDVGRGQILSIVGESGSGKSTLIRAIMGLLGSESRVSKGEILFKGTSLLAQSSEGLRKMRGPEMGMVFQNHASAMCPIRTIGDQYYEAVKEHRKTSRREVDRMALALFAKMKLTDGERLLRRYPFELSGGMVQRVGIAMAMLLGPDLLLADEPTSALDVIVKAMVARELVRLRTEKGVSIVMVTHDIGLAARISDCIAVINRGRLVEYGNVSSVFEDPQNAYTKALIRAVPKLEARRVHEIVA